MLTFFNPAFDGGVACRFAIDPYLCKDKQQHDE